jgi:hypothetical protein
MDFSLPLSNFKVKSDLYVYMYYLVIYLLLILYNEDNIPYALILFSIITYNTVTLETDFFLINNIT